MEEFSASPTEPVVSKRFPLLEWLLVLTGQALFFQAFPAAWTRLIAAVGGVAHAVLTVVDVRNWSVWAYIVGLTLVLVILVCLKVWKDQAESQAALRRWSDSRR